MNYCYRIVKNVIGENFGESLQIYQSFIHQLLLSFENRLSTLVLLRKELAAFASASPNLLMRLLSIELGPLGLCWCCHPAGRNLLEIVGNLYGLCGGSKWISDSAHCICIV